MNAGCGGANINVVADPPGPAGISLVLDASGNPLVAHRDAGGENLRLAGWVG